MHSEEKIKQHEALESKDLKTKESENSSESSDEHLEEEEAQ